MKPDSLFNFSRFKLVEWTRLHSSFKVVIDLYCWNCSSFMTEIGNIWQSYFEIFIFLNTIQHHHFVIFRLLMPQSESITLHHCNFYLRTFINVKSEIDFTPRLYVRTNLRDCLLRFTKGMFSIKLTS